MSATGTNLHQPMCCGREMNKEAKHRYKCSLCKCLVLITSIVTTEHICHKELEEARNSND